MATLEMVRLDLEGLVAKGQLKLEEAQRLYDMREPARASGMLVSTFSILGALAAAAGVVLLEPTAIAGLIIAVLCLVSGQYVMRRGDASLNVLAAALGIGAAAGLIGWFALEFGDDVAPIVTNGFATATTFVIAWLFRSRFLAAMVPLGIGAMIGSGGAYWHAAYAIYVREAAVSILLFTALAAALFWAARRFSRNERSPLALVAARMSLVVANFGWWVGSLWGDYVGEHLFGAATRTPGQDYSVWRAARHTWRETALHIDDTLFALGWVGFAIAMIVIGRRMKHRFVEIAGVVFLAINAFTQYFEYFRDAPVGLILGGVSLIALSVGLVKWQMMRAQIAVLHEA